MMFQCFNMFQKQCNMGKNSIYQSIKESCLKFQIKKEFVVKHGQIIATISQVSKFHKFLYIIAISLKLLQKVFQPQDRERKIMHIGRQDYTNPVPRRIQLGPLQPAEFAPNPGVYALALLLTLQTAGTNNNPCGPRISHDCTRRIKRKND